MQTRPDETGDVLMDVRGLSVHYGLRGGSLARLLGRETGTVRAIDGIDLQLRKGEVLGLVGESGSGKTTLGRALLGLAPATSGSILFGERDIATLSGRERRGKGDRGGMQAREVVDVVVVEHVRERRVEESGGLRCERFAPAQHAGRAFAASEGLQQRIEHHAIGASGDGDRDAVGDVQPRARVDGLAVAQAAERMNEFSGEGHG